MKQKVLVFDIETTPMTAYVWGLKDQNIGLNQLIQDWTVLSFAAKWLGDPPSKVMYFDTSCNKDMRNDRNVLERIWKLLDEADIVITQYGTGFDSPKLNARFIEQGMFPPKPYKHLDTYRIASKVASFTSNKLEYLTNKLCVKYKKLLHKKFPGMSLWNECLKGNKKAWAEMKRYNIHDVLSTEELYMKLRAWAPKNAPNIFAGIEPGCCPRCGVKGSMIHKGFHYYAKSKTRRLRCTSCGSWTEGNKEAY